MIGMMKTSTCCLLATVILADAGWPWAAIARGGGSLQVASDQLKLGQPVLIEDLPAFATRCFPAPVPPAAQKVHVVASVVSLAGFPVLQAGWEPLRPWMNSSETGYETVDQIFDNAAAKHVVFLCVRTFSSQGCEAILTAFAKHAEKQQDHVPFVELKLNYPSIWSVGDSDNPGKLGFTTQADFLEDLHLVAVPLNGNFDVEVYRDFQVDSNATTCVGRASNPARSANRPVVADILHSVEELGVLEHKLCIMIIGSGTVSMTVGPRYPGPFLVPAVPAAGRVAAAACERSRILVNEGVDVAVTVAADDASELTLSAMLGEALEALAVRNRWRGLVPPGGTGAALLISSGDLAAAGMFRDSKQDCISIWVCRGASSSEVVEATEFWITAVTDTAVVTLKDGVAAHSFVPPSEFSNGSWKVPWREFRILIPDGLRRPQEVTLSASSINKVRLAADTSRHSDPAAYRWALAENTSDAVLRLTTLSSLAGHGVGLIDCRLPCFLYLAATASAHDAEAHVPLTVRAVLDSQGIKQLVEGEELKQMLPGNQSQVFAYSIRRFDTAVLIAVTRLSGMASFVVSSSPQFTAGTTTGQAEAVILLEPAANVFQAAAAAARDGEPPVLYIQVLSGMPRTRFSISARSQAHAKWLLNGATTQGAVKVSRYDRYRFYVSEAEVNPDLEVAIEVIPHSGSVVIYAACDPNRYPQPNHHDWSRRLSGQGHLVIAASSRAFRAGWIFITVTSGSLAAYSLRIRWGDEAVKLKDGVQERGYLAAGSLRWFSLDAGQPENQPVAIRAEALAGAFGICVRSAKPPRRLGGWRQWRQELLQRLRGVAPRGWREELGCSYSAIANSSMGVGASLAAIDVPGEAAVDTLELGLLGLSSSGLATNASEFLLQAILNGVVTLSEEQTVVVDSLGPPCCAATSTTGVKLHRVYRHYTRFSSGSLRLFVTPLGAGLLTGAKLFARRKGEPQWFQTQEAVKERVLQLYLNLQDMIGQHRGGFWLEAAIEVERPTNFTFSVLSDFATEDLPTRLSQNVPVFDNLSEVALAKYAFETSTEAATLCLKPCYGQFRVEITSDAVQSQAPDAFLHGNCTRLQSSASKPLAGSVVVEKLASATSSTYEIELATHLANSYIELPHSTVLKLAARQIKCSTHDVSKVRSCALHAVFNFDAAEVGLAAPGHARILRHTLVAMKMDPDLHADTTCGLLTALSQNCTVGTMLVQAGTDGSQRKLEGMLNLDEQNSTIMVNVLATLEGEQGSSLAAASYTPLELASEVFDMSPDTEAESTANMRLAFLMLALCASLWLFNKGGNCKGRPDIREVPERIEMQMAYDLHEEGTASLLIPQSYVPPNV